MRLNNKTALITGGARGMGAEEAKLFAREGASVVIGDVLETEGNALAREIAGQGGECVFVKLDVTSAADWEKAISLAVSSYGKLNVLVNNAGILFRENMDNATEAGWLKTMDVNAKGVFLGCKLVHPEMCRAGGGSIINISSVSAMVSLGYPAYNASKGAVRTFTKSVSKEYARDNIRVNSIHPGVIRTSMSANDPRSKEEWYELIPLGRMAEPIEVAYGALYLASDDSSYVTGSEIVIDGGYTAQ